jgi:hypothetical protein
LTRAPMMTGSRGSAGSWVLDSGIATRTMVVRYHRQA